MPEIKAPAPNHGNWHQKQQESMSVGDKVADAVARFIGSWKGIIFSNLIVLFWITLNVVAIYGLKWDPYPFILLNLVFSWQAYNSAPLIMMAQNRQSDKDKIIAEHQYEHQEKELLNNTRLTEQVHEMSMEIHQHLIKDKEA